MATTGDLVRLTALTEADSPHLQRWINDRHNVILNAAYRPVHEAGHRSWFEEVQRRRDLVILGIRDVASGDLVGTCQLRAIDPVHRSAELQIRIGEVAAQGRGLGGAALRNLLRIGFRDLNLERIFLHVFEDNRRAMALYERAGFVREGVARRGAWIDGRYKDVVLMALLRDEYTESEGPA